MVLLLLAAWPQAVCSAQPTPGNVDVLFLFTPEDYAWGVSPVNVTVDAVTASRNAAASLNMGFTYQANASGAFIEIGGLAPAAGSWNWTLLKWGVGGNWEKWNGSESGLSARPGESIAWCPSDRLLPVPDPLSRYPWPMFRSSASRRGESLSSAPLSNLSYWTASVDAPVLSSPCVANGKVFVISGGAGGAPARAFGLREDSGAVLWEKEIGATGLQYSSPAYAEGKVIFGASNGKLKALSATTGELVWEHTMDPVENISSSPAIIDGRVLFSGGGGTVKCLDLAGNVLWTAATAGPVNITSPSVLTDGTISDRVVACAGYGIVFCLNLSDGGQLWNTTVGDLPHHDRFIATPPISQTGFGFPLLTRCEPPDNPSWLKLCSLNLKDGVTQWTANYNLSDSSPALAAGGMFLGTSTEFVGHHPDRGTRSWGIPLAPVDGSPAVAEGYVYFATDGPDGTVACARVGGFLEWTRTFNTSFFSSPAVADGRLFVCGMDGSVLCLGRPPQARLSAVLGTSAKSPSAGATVELKAVFTNTGEAPATFIAYLTVDGNKTAVKTGSMEVPAGGTRTAALEWKAVKGVHRLNMTFDGADAAVNGTSVNVSAPSGACASAVAVISVLGFASAVPMIAAFSRRKGGTGR
jgi:outer membrane protein assembly factor BamB